MNTSLACTSSPRGTGTTSVRKLIVPLDYPPITVSPAIVQTSPHTAARLRISNEAVLIQAVFFIDPKGCEFIHKLSVLPVLSNHHVICRWVVQHEPAASARELTAAERQRLIEQFAVEVGPLLKSVSCRL